MSRVSAYRFFVRLSFVSKGATHAGLGGHLAGLAGLAGHLAGHRVPACLDAVGVAEPDWNEGYVMLQAGVQAGAQAPGIL